MGDAADDAYDMAIEQAMEYSADYSAGYGQASRMSDEALVTAVERLVEADAPSARAAIVGNICIYYRARGRLSPKQQNVLRRAYANDHADDAREG